MEMRGHNVPTGHICKEGEKWHRVNFENVVFFSIVNLSRLAGVASVSGKVKKGEYDGN